LLIDGTKIVLATTNTEPFGRGFRDRLDTAPATVSITFSKPINTFALRISYVFPPDEFLTDFNIGLPDKLTGTLGVVDGVVTSTVPGDSGRGELAWSNINTTTVSFTIGNIESSTIKPALAVDGFAISMVPEPKNRAQSNRDAKSDVPENPFEFLLDLIPESMPSPSDK
jgi:hypothetical protein